MRRSGSAHCSGSDATDAVSQESSKPAYVSFRRMSSLEAPRILRCACIHVDAEIRNVVSK